MRHYGRQTLCVDRAKSMDKVNSVFQALVLGNDQQVMQKLQMDYILGFLASFTDLRKAKTEATAKTAEA
eukprot:2492723-Prorocentrum_lima.AAC.1